VCTIFSSNAIELKCKTLQKNIYIFICEVFGVFDNHFIMKFKILYMASIEFPKNTHATVFHPCL